jgi:hypothetical protein
MRLVTYNVEWFANLFDEGGKLLEDDQWSGRRDVTRNQQIGALGQVFQALEADAVMVIEAPDTSRHRDGAAALEGFATRFNLRIRKAVSGFDNQTQQEIILLYDPDVLDATHAPVGAMSDANGGRDAPRFDSSFRLDLNIGATEDLIQFSKPPLELSIDSVLGTFRMIGVHIKSKAPHGARTPDEVIRLAIANRRKQLAQCIWLRQRVTGHISAGDPVLVLGDFNDGPGLDEYEKLFGQSGIEIVLGKDLSAEQQLFDPHAHQALQSRVSAQPTTARFYIRHEERYLSALLDFIMVCPILRPKARRWRIWHPFDDPPCWQNDILCKALLAASDHFPVSVELNPP